MLWSIGLDGVFMEIDRQLDSYDEISKQMKSLDSEYYNFRLQELAKKIKSQLNETLAKKKFSA